MQRRSNMSGPKANVESCGRHRNSFYCYMECWLLKQTSSSQENTEKNMPFYPFQVDQVEKRSSYITILYFYVWLFCLHVCKCITWRTEEGVGSPGAGAVSYHGCELPYGSWEPSRALCKSKCSWSLSHPSRFNIPPILKGMYIHFLD